MRLATLSTPAGPRAVAQRGDRFIDLAATDPGLPNSVRLVLAGSRHVRAAAQEAVDSPHAVGYPAEGAVYLPPVPDPPKILCVGLNYRDHAIEGGKAIPSEPVLFCKYPNTLAAHGGAIILPRVSDKVDYEAELVVVVGKRGKNIPESSAMEYVGGYTCGHDVSARDWQLEKPEKQWSIGKTFDTFAPVGPVAVSKPTSWPTSHNLQVHPVAAQRRQSMQNSNTQGIHLHRAADGRRTSRRSSPWNRGI